MSGKMKEKPGPERIERARANAEIARRRLSSTAGALQYRLKPATLANEAWNNVKEKSGQLTGSALQAVKDRPVTASSIFAALVVFLARDPLWSVFSDIFDHKEKKGLATAKPPVKRDTRHSSKRKRHDVTAPPAAKSTRQPEKQGVSA